MRYGKEQRPIALLEFSTWWHLHGGKAHQFARRKEREIERTESPALSLPSSANFQSYPTGILRDDKTNASIRQEADPDVSTTRRICYFRSLLSLNVTIGFGQMANCGNVTEELAGPRRVIGLLSVTQAAKPRLKDCQ